MRQRGWKHYGVQTLPENTFYKHERDESLKTVGRIKKAKMLAAVFVGIGVLLTIGYHPFFWIQTIRIEGVESMPTATIQQHIEQTISGRRFFVIPNNNIFFLRYSDIRQTVEQFIIPESISITPQWGRVLRIQVKEYPIVVYWKQGSVWYSINEKGYITEQIPNTYVIPERAIVLEDSGRTVSVGAAIIAPDQIQWLLETQKLLYERLGLTPNSVIVSNTQPDIVEINSSSFLFVLTLNDSPQAQILRLKTLLDTKPVLMTSKTRYRIDLRFSEKVYYEKLL